MTQNNISWIFDEENNIITSRLVYFVDEAKIGIENCTSDVDASKWINEFADDLVDILDEVCKNPTKVK